MIPSFGLYTMNKLGLRPDLKHLPITELGCVAGASALIFADDYLKAYPENKVAIINLEFPSNTLQMNDFSWDNIVGAALFADGVSCAILSNESSLYKIKKTKMAQLLNTTDILGYNITNTGLLMNLAKELPILIEDNFVAIVTEFLAESSKNISDIDHFWSIRN